MWTVYLTSTNKFALYGSAVDCPPHLGPRKWSSNGLTGCTPSYSPEMWQYVMVWFLISNILKFTTQISKSLQGDTCCHHRNFFRMSALCHLAVVANSLASTLAWNSRSLLLMCIHNAPTYRYSLAAMTYHIETIYMSIYRGNTIPQ